MLERVPMQLIIFFILLCCVVIFFSGTVETRLYSFPFETAKAGGGTMRRQGNEMLFGGKIFKKEEVHVETF